MHYSLAESGAGCAATRVPGLNRRKQRNSTSTFTHTVTRNPRGCTRRDDTRPEFTSLMYVLGGDRSLSHELLIVRRHNSPRVSHPLSVPLPPPPAPVPAHSSLLCTSALEIRACACSPAVTNEYVLLRAEFTPGGVSSSPLFCRITLADDS